MRFKVTSIEYVYRVRVFADEGRSAAEIPDLPATAFDIKGRTVYPDGRQVVFNSRKDFAERKVDVGGSETRAKHLVAPGVTPDCVMEVSWAEMANGPFQGLPRRYQGGLYSQWTLANPFPTKVLCVEVAKAFPLAWSLNPGKTQKPELKEDWGFRSYTFRDLPALEIPPYGLRPLLNLPNLVMFFQPERLGAVGQRTPEVYWPEATTYLYKDDYEEGISKGPAFRDFAMEITAGLPEAPADRAAELLNRLNQRICNMGHATHAEEAALPKRFWDDFQFKDLGQAVKSKKTNNLGMRLLFYHLLKQAGLVPKIGKVVDRDRAFFDWTQLNPWQFHHDLIGIDLPAGGTAWVDPTLRHATPGVIHPDYTGVNMLQIDTATWKPSRGTIPGRSASANGRKYTYILDLTDDGDTFDMRSEFTGYPEYVERQSYMALEPREQEKALRERFEKAMKNLVVSEAVVSDTADPKKDVTWRVKGSLERGPGRSRAVDPFPGMPWPLWVPPQMDQERKVAIVLPYLSLQIAQSQFQVPQGFKPRLQEEMRQENEFGRVFWVPAFDPATRKASVTLRVEVNTLSRGADRWESFRTFLGWIETACRRQVVLVREG
ncbi:MAG TPA: hypothetical protein VGK03_04980 [Geothrix sp.]